ncbi:hypothetical protein [Paenibacillus sp. 8b26]|uniref:hypothetical protein n=1 Tax=Paenibacillus sp. 8b26 TaxID=3424133 RepID=UPI003D64A375
MKKFILVFFSVIIVSVFLQFPTFAAEINAKEILKKKYPREIVTLSKSADLNGDGKKEYFLLTEAGNFFLVNSKGAVVLINTNIISDEFFEQPTIQIYQVSKKEKHVAITFEYGPSNTQFYAYQYRNGTLFNKLSIMGDQGVQVDIKGTVKQYWKKYRPEGGWDLAIATYSWRTSKNKYLGADLLS